MVDYDDDKVMDNVFRGIMVLMLPVTLVLFLIGWVAEKLFKGKV